MPMRSIDFLFMPNRQKPIRRFKMQQVDGLANLGGEFDSHSSKAIQMILFCRAGLGCRRDDSGGSMQQPNGIGCFIPLLPAGSAAAVVINPALGEQLVVGEESETGGCQSTKHTAHLADSHRE